MLIYVKYLKKKIVKFNVENTEVMQWSGIPAVDGPGTDL